MCWSYKGDALSICFRTPYHRLPTPNDPITYWAADLGRDVGSLPYGLNIWAPKKVLNVEWDDGFDQLVARIAQWRRVKVVSYRAGDWEAKLRAASSAIQYPSVGLR